MRTVTLSPKAISDLEELKKSDLKLPSKAVSLIAEIAVTPYEGTGKPEPLKHDLKGKWSRRISQEHRLVYEVKETTINIISCKYHYE